MRYSAEMKSMEDPKYEAGLVCADCADDLYFSERVILLEVVMPTSGKELSYPPMQSAVGYAFAPHVYHKECWRGYVEFLLEDNEESDFHPIKVHGGVSQCGICSSTILEGEPTLVAKEGLLTPNPRVPDGEYPKFSPIRVTDVLCVACARILNGMITMWTPDVSFSGECKRCTTDRVWRAGEQCAHK